MKKFLALVTIVLAANTQAGTDVIYGKDNRLDIYQVTNPLHKKLAQSTAAMVYTGSFKVTGTKGIFDIAADTLEVAQNICPSEKFAQQPTPGICSGFLVGPDTLVTAGHCFHSVGPVDKVCEAFAWVFDLNIKYPGANPLKNVPASNVYLCKQVITAQLSATADFAVIKLDRPVVGREPLKYRTSGRISNSANLVVIGHPTGLPTKVSDGGRVTRNTDPTRFSTTLDTFQGNSGSAVFDATTGQVEGILIQGKTDYVLSKADDPKSCKVVNKCDDFGNNCDYKMPEGPVQWGEVVLRLDQVIPFIQKSNNLTVAK